MARFEKGNKMSKGRSKGTPNKLTADIREAFYNLVHDNLDTIREDIETLEPKDRVKIYIELAKFVLPTLKSTEYSTKEVAFTPVNIILDE